MKTRLFALLLVLFLGLGFPVSAGEERPANFIFLIDVSGSMLYKNEMVAGADGQKVTLFEGLRQALAQIVQDNRLLGSKSRAAFITFGTQVTEKTDWPNRLETAEDRQKLLADIQSPEQLSADKHGDTYMGGALSMALERANKLYAESDPCTTTFIVMLTDGWDEPPRGATQKVRDVAAQLAARSNQIQAKVGVKTWRVLVIGLQHLPDRKVGTTTAKELAEALNGEFIDVTKASGGSVPEKIFLSLKKTIEGLKGEIKLAGGLPGGLLDFGTVSGNGAAKASVPLQLKSCYAEELTGVKECSADLPKDKALDLARTAAPGGEVKLASLLPSGAISLKLAPGEHVMAPNFDQQKGRSTVTEPVEVLLQAHNNCPAGHFVGALKLLSTAKVDDSIPYKVSVPGRLVSEQEEIKLTVAKTGLFWSESAEGTMEESLKELSGSRSQSVYNITVTPESAVLQSGNKHESSGGARIDAEQINHGKPLSVTLDTSKSERQPFHLNLFIPANQVPGVYRGKLNLTVSGNTDITAPGEIDYEVVVEPSPWEKVAPIAVPMFLLTIVLVPFGVFLWWKNYGSR